MKTVGAYVVVFYSGVFYVLVHKRSQRIRHGGTICALGGTIERGERAVDAAVREVHEESGLRISSGSARILSCTDTHINYTWLYKSFPTLGKPSILEVDPFDFDVPGGFVVARHCWAPLPALIKFLETHKSARYEPSFLELKALAKRLKIT